MRRLSRETVRMRIAIKLAVMKPYQKTRSGISTEAIREWIAEMLTDEIMGTPEGESILLVPDLAGPRLSPRRGRWGEDEPHPFPEMPFADH